jgi:Protein of unknown function (DUF5131)
MGAQSKIEWTDSTFNPWVGCTKVARTRGAPSACDFCYAEKWAKRSGQVEWGNHPRRRTTEAYWRNPLAWNNRARLFQTEHGRRQRVFCARTRRPATADWGDGYPVEQIRAPGGVHLIVSALPTFGIDRILGVMVKRGLNFLQRLDRSHSANRRMRSPPPNGG